MRPRRLSGSSIHGLFQARILEWVVISFTRRSSRPRDRTLVSCTAGRFFTDWATREAEGLWEPWFRRWVIPSWYPAFLLFWWNKSQTHSLDHIHCTLNCTVQRVPVASGSWNSTKNFIIIHWFSFQHTISFESNGSIKSYLWGQPRYRQMLTCYWWQGGKKLLNTADQYLVSLLQPSADIKYISLQLQK